MTPEQFDRLIKTKTKEIERYATVYFPTDAGNTAIRFINGNFKAQGWQGSTFQPWKPNKRGGRILVNKGHLRSASYYTTAPFMAIIKNVLPYAKIHNEGGTVQVPVTDEMRKYAWAMYYKNGGKKREAKSGKWKGLALTKKTFLNIKIDQRQFAPTQTSPSPILDKAIDRKIVQALKQMFPQMR